MLNRNTIGTVISYLNTHCCPTFKLILKFRFSPGIFIATIFSTLVAAAKESNMVFRFSTMHAGYDSLLFDNLRKNKNQFTVTLSYPDYLHMVSFSLAFCIVKRSRRSYPKNRKRQQKRHYLYTRPVTHMF